MEDEKILVVPDNTYMRACMRACAREPVCGRDSLWHPIAFLEFFCRLWLKTCISTVRDAVHGGVAKSLVERVLVTAYMRIGILLLLKKFNNDII